MTFLRAGGDCERYPNRMEVPLLRNGCPAGDFRECSEWVPDHSPANETHRRLFSAILAEVLCHVRAHEIRSWVESEWELRAACAASDWDRARAIFDNAKTRNLVSSERLAILRLQFIGEFVNKKLIAVMP